MAPNLRLLRGASFAWIVGALAPALLPSACSSDSTTGSPLGDDASMGAPDTSLPGAETGAPGDDGATLGSDDGGPIRDAADASDATEATEAAAPPMDAAVPVDGSTLGCGVGNDGEPLELRCTGLYADWPTRAISGDVKQYDPGLHLWSDGAIKTRWIYLPPAADGGAGREPIDTSDMNEWVFPNGTKFWKEFVVNGKRIETRLLWKRDNGLWYRTTYRWSDDEMSTTEMVDGQVNANDAGYEVPSQTKCYTCHQGRVDNVLGFEAVALASAGATPITMTKLASDHLITDVPDASLAIPGDATAIAALGYLHANCGTACHNGGNGLAKGTGFHMRLDVGKMSSVAATDTYTTGVGVPTSPGGFQIPGVDNTMRLAPYDAGTSCVYYRMNTRGDLTQMPPIDTHRVDDAGLAIIGNWISRGCK